jgi:hypothetical protein
MIGWHLFKANYLCFINHFKTGIRESPERSSYIYPLNRKRKGNEANIFSHSSYTIVCSNRNR